MVSWEKNLLRLWKICSLYKEIWFLKLEMTQTQSENSLSFLIYIREIEKPDFSLGWFCPTLPLRIPLLSPTVSNCIEFVGRGFALRSRELETRNMYSCVISGFACVSRFVCFPDENVISCCWFSHDPTNKYFLLSNEFYLTAITCIILRDVFLNLEACFSKHILFDVSNLIIF